ncbi:MAG TPA: NAD(P)/FAD-dependent oxidoreductase [Nevskiaceae bacterium]|nr:NAD(P)/FAD-dependent oxidoreductase [Nevskiaceae bacterium]
MTYSTASPVQHYDAVVIGAGVAGLYALYRLREAGFRVKVYETGAGVGGTWYWNRYPGARVDSQSYIYQFWFSEELLKEWEWSEHYAAQPENERYFNYVADRFDLRKDIQFETTVTAAHFDEAARRWTIETSGGETVTAQYFISCAGMLSAPMTSMFEGQEKFEGRIFHTARWPKEDLEFEGKRVGVVGTGATGIQVIQTLSRKVGHLTVFQRTPQYAIPMRNYRHTSAEHLAFRARYPVIKELVHTTFAGFDYDFTNGAFADHSPKERQKIYEKLWAEGTLNFWIGSFQELFIDPKVNEEMSEFVREKIRKRIHDPKVAEMLVPTTYGFGTHRVPLETKYFESYNRPNVRLIDAKANPIVSMTEKGAKTADGEVHELDYLILATGFDAGTGALTRIDVRGRGGRSLREDWGRDIRTTMGLQVHGYPNLFTTGAPLAPAAAFCNMTTCLQQQVDWIADCIQHLRAKGLTEIEPTVETQDAWVAHHDEIANATLVTKTDSWYMGSNVKGKPRRLLSYIGGVGAYRQACDQVKASGYAGFATR